MAEPATSLQDLYLKAGSGTIQWHGLTVSNAFAIPIEARRVEFEGEFVSAIDSPWQGFVVRASGGMLDCEGLRNRSFVLWQKTAPVKFNFAVRRTTKRECTMTLWNVWRYGAEGAPQNFLHNAGMIVEQVCPTTFTFRCSDGWGDPNFGDLVFTVRELSGRVEPTIKATVTR